MGKATSWDAAGIVAAIIAACIFVLLLIASTVALMATPSTGCSLCGCSKALETLGLPPDLKAGDVPLLAGGAAGAALAFSRVLAGVGAWFTGLGAAGRARAGVGTNYMQNDRGAGGTDTTHDHEVVMVTRTTFIKRMVLPTTMIILLMSMVARGS